MQVTAGKEADRVSHQPVKDLSLMNTHLPISLSKAYKQLGILPAHRHYGVIFFHDAAGNPKFYISNSLMFGATAAVYAFNRVSRSIWFLMNKMLVIPCGVFYDDFPLLSPCETASNADESASELLDLLGWRHARTGPKGLPFASCLVPSWTYLVCRRAW